MNNVLCFPNVKLDAIKPRLDYDSGNEIVNGLIERFADNEQTVKRIKKLWDGKCSPEPYMYGCTHDKVWSKQKYHLSAHGLWNKPFPLPSKTSIKSIGGVLGKNVLEGGTDPFMWMDRKFKLSQNILREHKGLPLEIYTSSDLLGKDEYMNLLDKEHHTINLVYTTTNDNVNAYIQPGCPSYKRLERTFIRLSQNGYNVKWVYIKYNNIELPSDMRCYNELNKWHLCDNHRTVKVNLNIYQTNQMEVATGRNFTKYRVKGIDKYASGIVE